MSNLTEKEIIKIIEDKKINECSPKQKAQVMDFAFGGEFMADNNKGSKRKYKETKGDA
jgi:hypothetical protein